jgi:protein-S-isoprenylcysteine O-methyltransferase Ste14
MTTILWFLVDVLAQGIVIVYPGVFVFWFVMHGKIDRWRKLGRKSYWIAAIGWPVTALPLLYFRREIFLVQWTNSGWLQALGVLALLLSVAVAITATREIPSRTLVGLAELEPQKNKQPLLNRGIYSRTRNPIYFFHWLLVFGAAALSGYAANWIFFALDCVLLPLMIRAEERELLARYGAEFEAYMRRVPRFFPRLIPGQPVRPV